MAHKMTMEFYWLFLVCLHAMPGTTVALLRVCAIFKNYTSFDFLKLKYTVRWGHPQINTGLHWAQGLCIPALYI